MTKLIRLKSTYAAGAAGASVLALMIGLGVTGLHAESAPLAGQPLQSYADIVAADKPAVVTVTTEIVERQPDMQMQGAPDGSMPPEEFFRRFFGQNGPMPGFPMVPGMPGQGGPEGAPRKGMALGSGFIISADGHIVTNNHVIDHATKITVTLDDGTELPATLIGTDPKNDIAVLKVDAKSNLPTVTWGNSDALRLGDPVLAIGDPFGIGTTVTAGIVSARGRDLHSGPYDDFIQVDAAINHGNSGGPLVDASGKVVGINTAIYSPNGGNVGVGFAIPSAQAEKVVEALIANGSIEHGFIGVQIQPMDEQIAGAIGLKEAKGALVSGVKDGSPASDAGIKAGDVITAVNGTPVEDPRAVSRAIADMAPGDKAKIDLWHEGKAQTVDVTIGKLPGDEAAAKPASNGAEPANPVAELGLTVDDLTADTVQALGLPEGTQGAVITSVDPNGPAADQGLRAGDVVESVNQIAVTSAADLTGAVSAAQKAGHDAALLLVNRQGERQFVAVPFAKG